MKDRHSAASAPSSNVVMHVPHSSLCVPADLRADLLLSDSDLDELVVAGPAARMIGDVLPESVAAAVIDVITGPLIEDPKRVGKPLRRELEGVWSARRGTFRVLYRINDAQHEVVVLRVDHRRDIYRSP